MKLRAEVVESPKLTETERNHRLAQCSRIILECAARANKKTAAPRDGLDTGPESGNLYPGCEAGAPKECTRDGQKLK